MNKQHRRNNHNRDKQQKANPETEIGKKISVAYYTVIADEDGQRVDNFLRKKLPKVPKSKLYQIIRTGQVRVNKKRVKADSKLKINDIVRTPPIIINDKKNALIPAKYNDLLKSAVLFENNDYLIINKPAGIAVHSGSQHEFGIIDMIKAFFDKPWELCHRLDKDTSGCLLFASSRKALIHFQNQSQQKEVYKRYLTLVKGSWIANELMVNEPIAKKAGNPHDKEEQDSISIFNTEANYSKTSLMSVVIKTGRTHQIRIHSALKKHPIAMDNKYGDFNWNKALSERGLKRMFLHAHVLRFQGIDELIHVSAPLPDDLETFLDKYC